MKIRLTWKMSETRYKQEECELCDDAELYVMEDGELIDGLTAEEIKKDGFVMFRDDEGHFFLHAQQVVNIEPI